MSAIIETNEVWKTYPLGETEVQALRGVTLSVSKGEFIVLLGPSGSGKSSLLHLLGAMDRPSHGTVSLCGEDIGKLSATKQTTLRLKKIGFVFQTYNLLPTLTALENVELPMRLAGFKNPFRTKRAAELLEQVGLGPRVNHLPRQLSGGQRQRVAIARALANQPEVLLADEPTGNLDSESGATVLKILQDLHGSGQTIVLVTHNTELEKLAGRVWKMRDGRLQFQEN